MSMNAKRTAVPSRVEPSQCFRAEHVGSFLRPKALLDARERFRRGEIAAEQLRSAEDDAIRDVVKLQERAGLQVITDGEFRREYFHLDFLSQLGGVHTEAAGTLIGRDGKEHLVPPRISVVGNVRHVRDIQRSDFDFLHGCTSRTPKVTIPSPTMLHFRAGRAGISREHYQDLEPFYEDVAKAFAAEPIRWQRPVARTCSSMTPISPISATTRCEKVHAVAATIRTSSRTSMLAPSSTDSRSKSLRE